MSVVQRAVYGDWESTARALLVVTVVFVSGSQIESARSVAKFDVQRATHGNATAA